MAKNLSKLLYATVAYADIFGYPLTMEEAVRWLIGVKVKHLPLNASRWVKQKEQYFMLSGREHLVSLKRRRAQASRQKWIIARKTGFLLRLVPTIKLVGITGALAMNNVTPNDDIDLFIVTKRNMLWTTRLLATMLLDVLGRRRRPNQTQVRNKICLNMFMSEEGLCVARGEQDLFSAHEVLQMVPLWERDSVYRQFLKKNAWVKVFLPNAWEMAVRRPQEHERLRVSGYVSLVTYLFRFIEPVLKRLQERYMHRHRTTEILTNHVLQFHPQDARVWVKEALERRLKLRGLPLDKIFFAS